MNDLDTMSAIAHHRSFFETPLCAEIMRKYYDIISNMWSCEIILEVRNLSD